MLSVDKGSGTFAARVIETRSRVTLAAGAALLARALNARGSVTVAIE
jgi:hypothetical protein